MKKKLEHLVGVIYRTPFKIFEVNSEDGVSLCQPLGYFLSLGMTSDIQMLKSIRDFINKTEEFQAKLVEIKSISLGVAHYVNSITKEEPVGTIIPYRIENVPENSYDREGSIDLINKCDQELKGIIKRGEEIPRSLTNRLSKLNNLFTQIEQKMGWDDHRILITPPENVILYHMNVNYKQEGESHYRIGIFVTEKGGYNGR